MLSHERSCGGFEVVDEVPRRVESFRIKVAWRQILSGDEHCRRDSNVSEGVESFGQAVDFDRRVMIKVTNCAETAKRAAASSPKLSSVQIETQLCCEESCEFMRPCGATIYDALRWPV